MDAVTHSGPLPAEGLARDWAGLWERDPGAGLFHRPEYLAAWVPEIPGDARATIVEVRRDDGGLAGIATLRVDHGVLGFLPDPEVTDYLGPVSSPEDRDAVAESVLNAASELEGWDEAVLPGLTVDSAWVEALARAAKAAGFCVEERVHDVSPRVGIGEGYEAWLGALPGKLRHEIRRKARRVGAFTVRLTTPETLDEDFRHFVALHRSSSGPKGKFLDGRAAGFFERLVHAFSEKGWLRLAWLGLEGEDMAAVLSFSARGVWSVYNSAYNHAHRDLAPGMVLVAEAIRLAAEEGCHTFDFLRGAEPYKYRFGATDTAVVELRLRREET